MMDTVEDAIEAMRAGRMLVIADDEGRENEGDLVMDARFATAQSLNFMALYGRGLICAPMEAPRLERLGIPPMTDRGDDPRGTAFTVSVDLRGSTTGISALERARTAKALADPESRPTDFTRPGHLFPLAARPGGVLERRGHTEAAVDLSRLAGSPEPAGLICEIMNEDGSMARMGELEAFAARHGLPLICVADIARYRIAKEFSLELLAETSLPTVYGTFALRAYRDPLSGKEHLALMMGNTRSGAEPPLVRMHSECLTGDALGSLRCDCGEQYREALRRIAQAGRGAILYLRQEGRGIGLGAKLKAYALQDAGMDTVEANLQLGFAADERDYRVGALILEDLGLRRIRLLTNNPAKVAGLRERGIEVAERVPLEVSGNRFNDFYMETKRRRMGHVLTESATRKGRNA
jgi:3,4-dihydroxy 2-butanone 4-phosphate synthase / GTP cyclohydrolase II